MKRNSIINLGLFALGIFFLFAGPALFGKEFGLSVGFIFLMVGLYSLSRNTDENQQ
jgi:hypothetical protein